MNQMTRVMDWWHTAEETEWQCEELKANIRQNAESDVNWKTCGEITVFFTDFALVVHPEDQLAIRRIGDMMRNFKSVEAVSTWFKGISL